jgi:murein DD-endopeptidase MepM/ murein hydrolase activator NlpD
MKLTAVIFNIICLAALLTCPAYSKSFLTENEVVLRPSAYIKQGETLFVELKSNLKLKNPYFVFNNNKINLYKKSRGLYTGILGINALEKTDKYTITFYDKKGAINQATIINVISSDFPIDNIIISGEKSQLTIDQEEQKKIQNCLTKSNNKALWQNLPLITPTEGYITSLFGGIRYKNGLPTGNYHKGIDIGAPEGQDVFSVADGKVIMTEKFIYFGNTVIIDHGQGLASVYMHLSEITVKNNDKIKQGQNIAKVGSTGYATGPHLHFGIYINGIAVNPLGEWIKILPMNIN